MNKLDANRKTPVIILTGFLGSGKTSFLSQLLTRLADLDEASNTAVIINEFGEFSLDHLLVNHVTDQTFELPGGCLCCNARGELVEKMLQLDVKMNSKEVHFDRLIIETSGVANAQILVSTLWNDPHVRIAYRLEKIVTVVSAIEWNAAFTRSREFTRQLAISDIVVVSKADLLGKYSANQELARLEAGITSINKSTKILILPLANDGMKEIIDGNFTNNSHDIPPESGTHNSSVFKTLTLIHFKPVSQITIGYFMDILLSRHSTQLLRVKGLVQTTENSDVPMVVQAVGPTNSPISWLDKWDSSPVTQLTVVYTGNITEQIVGLFNSMLDIPISDQPDRVAIIENPLSVTGMGKFDPGEF